MIIEWSKPEVSLPLCKGAKLKQLNEGQQTGGYYRGKSSQSESKLTRNEVFAKITKETYCNLMIISLISIFLKKHINKVWNNIFKMNNAKISFVFLSNQCIMRKCFENIED